MVHETNKRHSSPKKPASIFKWVLMTIILALVITAIMLPNCAYFREKALKSASKRMLESLAAVQEQYRKKNKTYAADLKDLPDYSIQDDSYVIQNLKADDSCWSAEAGRKYGRMFYQYDSCRGGLKEISE